jgi:ribosomal protein S15P/S13E
MIAFSLFFLIAFCNTDATDSAKLMEEQIKGLRAEFNSNLKNVRADLTKQATSLETQISALDSHVKSLPKDLITKSDLDKSFEHVQSLLDAIQMPDVSQFLKQEELNIATTATNLKIDELKAGIADLKKKTTAQKKASDSNKTQIDELKKGERTQDREIRKLKNVKKDLSEISERVEKLATLHEEQDKMLNKLLQQNEQKIETQFAKLKQDLKEELLKDAKGVFATMGAELGYLFALVRDSYVHVTYDIANRLGFEKEDVDSLFDKSSNLFAALWKTAQDLFASAKELFFSLLDVAKEKFPVILNFIQENTKGFWEDASKFFSAAWEKISEICSFVWEKMQLFGEKGMSIAQEQFQELQKYEMDDVKMAATNGMNNMRSHYEDLKTRPEVRSLLSAVSQKLTELLPDKSKPEIDGYVELGFMAVVFLLLFGLLYIILQMFCSCCCRKRSKLETSAPAQQKKEETTQTQTKEKTSSKKSSTPRKSKKNKRSK